MSLIIPKPERKSQRTPMLKDMPVRDRKYQPSRATRGNGHAGNEFEAGTGRVHEPVPVR